jgi:hypothetical protein
VDFYFGRIPGLAGRGPGFPLQSFGAALQRQKYFRFNPLRVPKTTFVSLWGLLRKIFKNLLQMAFVPAGENGIF